MKLKSASNQTKTLLREADGQLISKAALMEVLDRNLILAGVKITVRRYNTILTELGFELDDSISPIMHGAAVKKRAAREVEMDYVDPSDRWGAFRNDEA